MAACLKYRRTNARMISIISLVVLSVYICLYNYTMPVSVSVVDSTTNLIQRLPESNFEHIESHIDDQDNTVLHTQSQRQRTLQKPRGNNKKKKVIPNNSIMVIDKYKAMCCVNPKCGTSSVITFMLRASGVQNITIERLHKPEYLAQYGIRFIRAYSKEERDHILKNYFKFMVVRHPFDRLLSAYKDKFLYDKSYKPELVPYVINAFRFGNKSKSIDYYKQFYPAKLFEGAKHVFDNEPLEPIMNMSTEVKEYIKYLPPFEANDEHKPTFEEFLKLVAYAYGNDQHWGSFVNFCQIDSVQYDYIAKIETFSEDSLMIMQKFNETHPLPEGIEWEHMRNIKKIATQPDIPVNSNGIENATSKIHALYSKKISEYSTVNSSVVRDIYKKYKTDMDLFGYDFSLDTFEAFCTGFHTSDKSSC